MALEAEVWNDMRRSLSEGGGGRLMAALSKWKDAARLREVKRAVDGVGKLLPLRERRTLEATALWSTY